MKRQAAALAVVLLLVVSPAIARAPTEPDNCPRLDATQLGHLHMIVRLTRQPDGDWSGMGAQESGQGGFDAYRYQLAMMSYTLSPAQYRYTPAYRALDRELDARRIHEMLPFDVRRTWKQISRGARNFDPGLTALGEEWIDPVKDRNIMYGGHLFQMIETHQMLYGDALYDGPTSTKRQFDQLDYIDLKTPSVMAMYLVKQDKVIRHPMAWADGCAGSFMHAWSKPAVEQTHGELAKPVPPGTSPAHFAKAFRRTLTLASPIERK